MEPDGSSIVTDTAGRARAAAPAPVASRIAQQGYVTGLDIKEGAKTQTEAPEPRHETPRPPDAEQEQPPAMQRYDRRQGGRRSPCTT